MRRDAAVGQDGSSARHILTVGLLAVSVLNFVANILVSHLIPQSKYGAVGSVLALAALLAIPLASIQPAVTRQVSVARAGAVRLGPPLAVAAGGAVFIVVVARLLSPLLDRLLHLSGAWAIVLFGTYLAATLLEGVPRGSLVGQRRYLGVAIVITVGALARLAVAAGWSAVSPSDIGPLAGAALGEALTAVVLIAALYAWRPSGPRDEPLRVREVWLSAAGFTGLLSLMSIDTVAARHWLSGPSSGLYAAASIAGSIAYFMPSAAAVAIFPDVARGATSKDSHSFWVGLAEVSLLAFVTAGVLAGAAPVVVDVMFPAGYGGARVPLEILAASYAFLGVLGYLVNHQLAHRSRMIYLPWLGAVVLTAAVFLAHRSPTVVALDALGTSGGLLVVMSATSVLLERRPSEPGDAAASPLRPPVG